MNANRPLRPHVNAHLSALRQAPPRPDPRAPIAPRGRLRSWRHEQRHGVFAALAIALVLGGSLSIYVVHSQLAQAAARARTLALHTAARETSAALGSGAVLFVPEYGNKCRRRWLDNATGTLREGGEISCDEAVGWNATVPTPEKKVERRMDAIRNGFHSRNAGTVE
jgi:hypothetical protein